MDSVTIAVEDAWKAYFNSKMGTCHEGEFVEMTTWEYAPDLCKPCFFHCIKDNDVLAMGEPYPGTRDAFQYLAGFADLVIVTKRAPEMEDAVVELYKKHGLDEFVSTYNVNKDDKLQRCRKLRLDCLIDDSAANIEELRGTEVLPIIFNQQWNTHVEGDRVHGWGDACRFINYWRSGAYRHLKLPRSVA